MMDLEQVAARTQEVVGDFQERMLRFTALQADQHANLDDLQQHAAMLCREKLALVAEEDWRVSYAVLSALLDEWNLLTRALTFGLEAGKFIHLRFPQG